MKIFADKPLSIKESWSAIFKLFAKTFPKVLLIALILGISNTAINVLQDQFKANLVVVGMGMAAYVLLTTYISMLLSYRIYIVGEEQTMTLAQSFGFVWKKFPRMIAVTLLSMLVLGLIYIPILPIFFIKFFSVIVAKFVAVISMLFAVLFVLFVLWYVLILFMLMPLVLFDSKGIVATLKASYKLIWGNWWYAFIIVLPAIILASISSVIMLFVENNYWLTMVLSLFFGVFFIPLLDASVLIQFGNLKARKAKADEVAQVV